MNKANFGCGADLRDGYDNFDRFMFVDGVKQIDLQVLPLEIPDEYYGEILLFNVLEHLWVNPYDFMMEIHRILKKDGVVKIELPVYACLISHVRWFHTKAFFNPICINWNNKSFQNIKLFDKIKCFYKFMGFCKGFPFIRLHVYFELRKV